MFLLSYNAEKAVFQWQHTLVNKYQKGQKKIKSKNSFIRFVEPKGTLWSGIREAKPEEKEKKNQKQGGDSDNRM